MKKFFEKHDLFKLASIILVLVVILTWFLDSGIISNGTFAGSDPVKVGLFDLATYGSLGFYQFGMEFAFIFLVFGFYKFLGSIKAYQELTKNIANKFAGKEFIFVAITMFILAAFTGVTTNLLIPFAFVPFFMSVLSKMKVDKVASISATVGGILVGILGSTFSSAFTGPIVDVTLSTSIQGLTYDSALWYKVGAFVVGLAALLFFTYKKMNSSKQEALVDLFEEEVKEDKRRVNTIPLIISLAVLGIIFILGYIDWNNAFGITVFTEFANDLKEIEWLGAILGNSEFVAFGSWSLFSGVTMILITTLIIKLIYRVSLDEIFDEYLEGMKKGAKAAAVYFILCAVLLVSFQFPVIPGLISNIMDIDVNFVTIFTSTFIGGIFYNNPLHLMYSIGSAFATFESIELLPFIIQSAIGVVSFIAPTSVALALGLSMYDVKYKDWFKFIWKFLLVIVGLSLSAVAIALI